MVRLPVWRDFQIIPVGWVKSCHTIRAQRPYLVIGWSTAKDGQLLTGPDKKAYFLFYLLLCLHQDGVSGRCIPVWIWGVLRIAGYNQCRCEENNGREKSAAGSLIPFIWQLNKNHSFSNSVLLIFTAISMIPTTTLIAYMNLEAKFVILNYIYWFCFYVYNALFPQIKIKNSFKTKKLFYGICFLLCFTVVYISGKYTGFRFHWNIVDVYDLRFEERELNINILLQYLHNAAGVLLPIILIYFILNRNKIASFLLMTIILLNFGIGGHKSVLFSLVLTVVGFYFYKYRRTVFVFSFFAVINLIGFLEFIVVKTNFANQSSLGRFFRKHTGMSPSEYRRSMMETYY